MKQRWHVRFTPNAAEDLERIYVFLLERDARAAERARKTILKAIEMLELFPRSCRRAAAASDDSLRELVISFGARGYVALFRLQPPATVSVLALRHQREDDLR
ncbi:MAG TPA: type II toxin-antitoxin system RelE/ParE family toxin [Kofleriaceae bacterium]|jgi:plasmid stabilization system protein ParE|nr:type II toxin-antitoxin system RelE/ParE family toxin [Kofleriaceae bacterium]